MAIAADALGSIVNLDVVRNAGLTQLMQQLTGLDREFTDEEAKRTRYRGADWPADADTMIGMVRLNNIMRLGQEVIAQGIPGDFMECGVWRGGAAILMRAILRGCGVNDRNVWVADSFQGCPEPRPERFPQDRGDPHSGFKFLAVPLETVKANFARYGLLDDQVRFLPGWFKDTLPGPVRQIALLRADGDLYESTWQILTTMYPLVSPGGYVICDDYHNIPSCRKAIEDFRRYERIAEPLRDVDWCAVYWRKGSANVAMPDWEQEAVPA